MPETACEREQRRVRLSCADVVSLINVTHEGDGIPELLTGESEVRLFRVAEIIEELHRHGRHRLLPFRCHFGGRFGVIPSLSDPSHCGAESCEKPRKSRGKL